jgi:hypothetical protein
MKYVSFSKLGDFKALKMRNKNLEFLSGGFLSEKLLLSNIYWLIYRLNISQNWQIWYQILKEFITKSN